MHREGQSKSKPGTSVGGLDGKEGENIEMTHFKGSGGGEEGENTKMTHSKGSGGGEEGENTEMAHSKGSSGGKECENTEMTYSKGSGGGGGEEGEITEMTHSRGSGEGEEGEITEITHSRESGGGEEDGTTEVPRLVKLRRNICYGLENVVEQFFVREEHPLDTIIVSNEGYTALHVAILAGKYEIVKDLIERMSATDLEKKTASDSGGDTALTLVATTGKTEIAKCMVEKNSNLLAIQNARGYIPVTAACNVGHRDMTDYLYRATTADVLESHHGKYGFDLMRAGIDNKFLDICLDLIRRYPKLTVASVEEMVEISPIVIMSRQPDAFFSGCKLQFWQIWIYHWLTVELPTSSSNEVRIPVMTENPEERTSENERSTLEAFDRHLRSSLKP